VVGRTLSHYRVLQEIGRGGMGVVYRAEDLRLKRDVALKILPANFARDQERLARFEREAHIVAVLNHPNIAAIYGIEEADDSKYLVLELVPGETLAERLRHGPLALQEVLDILLQVADALEAAHEKGVVHRDLKPANIKITPEGKIKVLDFGLAKVFAPEGEPSSPDESPTITAIASREGLILGTAAYMSPEQARGRAIDRKADVWAFGCIAYELLTGRRAFGGETVSDTIAGILSAEPDWSALPANTPDNIRCLLRRCLRKKVRERLHDIADARLEIQDALAGSPEARAESGPRRNTRFALVTVAVIALLLGIGGTALLLRKGGNAPLESVRRISRLTHDVGVAEWPTWSPDGTLIAFSSNRSGNYEVYVGRIGGGQEVNITNDEAQDYQPSFSPDGNLIAFVSTRSSTSPMVKIGGTSNTEFRTYGGDVWIVPALGGPARRVAENGNFPSWRPDGKQIIYIGGLESHRAILSVATDGSAPVEILPGARSTWEIVRLHYSPNGKWISFETEDQRILIVPARGGEVRELARGTSHAWDPAGTHLYFVTRDVGGSTRVEVANIDQDGGSLRAPPHPLAILTGILRDVALSSDGRRMAVSQQEGSLYLTRLPLNAAGNDAGGPEEVLSSGHVMDRNPAVSPDSRYIAFSSNRLGKEEIWIYDLERHRQERLEMPTKSLSDSWSSWLPSGKELTVMRIPSDSPEVTALWVVALDGSRAEELKRSVRGLVFSPPSPDGTQVLYSADQNGVFQFFLLDLKTRQERVLTSSKWDKYQPAWSPDGRWIAYSSNAGQGGDIWRFPAAGGPEERLLSTNGRVRHLFYSRDGKWIYYQPNHLNMYRIPASGGRVEQVTHFPEATLFLEEPTISRDGRFLVYCKWTGGASIWLLDLAQGH
jgi:serine/threonine-protein kinase